jgi:hypothetical protein
LRGITLAWAVGLGLMTWRTAQEFHRPPVPGRLLGASVVFAALALLAEYEPATRAAVLAAWGFDLAVLFKLPPSAFTTAPFQSKATDPGQQIGGGQGRGSLKQHQTGG